jgi:hypothetical protein
MKHRIAMWGGAGFLVACFWAIYSLVAAPISSEPLVWALARLSCPIAFAGFYFRISIYMVLFANIATYAMIGLLVEILRRQRTHAQ